RDAHLSGFRELRAALAAPPPAHRADPDPGFTAPAEARGAADGTGSVRHLGRGRTARSPADLSPRDRRRGGARGAAQADRGGARGGLSTIRRSEEHTSE